MPKVSVLIATRNRAPFLKEAIDSVLAQTYPDYEIIVVDDGSTDNTKEVIQGYGDKIRYFVKESKCAAATRNFALSQARGEYIALLDDDDLWFPNKLEVQMNILENDPELGFVSNEASVTDGTGKIVTRQWQKKSSTPETFFGLYEESFIHASSILIRKSVIDQAGGYDESLQTTEDYDLWLRVTKNCKFRYLYSPLTFYRMHPLNKHKNDLQKIRDRVHVLMKAENAAHLTFWGKRARVAKEFYNYAGHFQNFGRYTLASKYYLRAVVTYPFVGRYYLPPDASQIRLTFFYRVLRTYLKAFYCFAKALNLQQSPKTPALAEKWSIGIYRMVYEKQCLKIQENALARNPVLTAKNIKGMKADFVADPFLVYESGSYHLFFEVLENNKGNIAWAVSKDGRKWKYQKTVLEGSIHYSYPFIFKWQGKYYMLPETYQANSVWLYEAVNFPEKWCFVKTLLAGKQFVDPTLFPFDGKFWLFVSDVTDGNLYLYYADSLQGTWQEHPKSPVIANNRSIARPGGSIFKVGERLIRLAQDDLETYGYALRAFEITRLNTLEYVEKELPESPLLKASGRGWNKDGMHHLSACPTGENEWIAAVDGKVISQK